MPEGKAAKTSSCASPVAFAILFAMVSFFSLPGLIIAHRWQSFDTPSAVPDIGIGILLTIANPMAISISTSLYQVLCPLTTNAPRPSDSPLSVCLETCVGRAWNAVAAALPLPHARDQHIANCAASLIISEGRF